MVEIQRNTLEGRSKVGTLNGVVRSGTGSIPKTHSKEEAILHHLRRACQRIIDDAH